MNPTRYILTRSCLQDGSMRLLKFNEFYFPESGTAQFVDDRGKEYSAQIDRDQMRVLGLGELYHDHNLSVNDVLMITPVAPGRYEVGAVVKPYSTPRARQTRRPASARNEREDTQTRREASPSVREVRAQASSQGQSNLQARRRSGPSGGGGRNLSGLGEERRPEEIPAPSLKPIAPAFAPQVPQAGRQELTLPAPLPAFGSRERAERDRAERDRAERERAERVNTEKAGGETPAAETAATEAAPTSEPDARSDRAASRMAPGVLEDQIAEFARLTGYRLTLLGHGLMRLSADLGPQYSYTVLLATEPMATTYPEWDGSDDHRALVTPEENRAPGVPRLTREALVSLTEHARLAPLGALDLRGYWRSGDINLESAASVAELVSAHLAQRGAFTYVLLTLAQQPAQTVLSLTELAQRLGNGVSLNDMQSVLETLSRPPFLAVTLLPDHQFLLRSSVTDLLADLADYAQGVRRRLRSPGAQTAAQTTPAHTTSAPPPVLLEP